MGRGQPKSRREQIMELKARKELRKQKKRDKKVRGLDGAPKQVPKTIDSMREKDITTVGDLQHEDNLELAQEFTNDEFSSYFQKSYEPKVFITTSDSPCTKTRVFCKELKKIIPNSEAWYRRHASVKKMVKKCVDRGFTDMIIVNENRREPNGLLLIHLPNGPTALFRLSNVKITSELKKKTSQFSLHRPEVILNNFTTKLGYTVSRMLAAIFHYEPQFKGSRCVTFHNQRDYIFFRHHRYTFTSTAKPRLMELGPRFTLKLRSLQEGTFDSKTGEYIWIIQGRRHQLETSRRRFFL